MSQIQAALDELVEQRNRIDAAIAALSAVMPRTETLRALPAAKPQAYVAVPEGKAPASTKEVLAQIHQLKIALVLNRQSVRTPSGKPWSKSIVMNLLARARKPATKPMTKAKPTPVPVPPPAPATPPKAAKKAPPKAAPKPTAPPVTLVKRACGDCRVTFSGEAGARPPFRCPKCAAAAIVNPGHSDDLEDLPLGARRG